MAKKKKKSDVMVGSTVVGLIMLWLALPVIAGLFNIGAPDGPRIYPAGMHSSLFGLGYRAAGRGEPHSSMTSWLYTRPWFYGMDPKPIPQDKAEAVKEWLEEKCH